MKCNITVKDMNGKDALLMDDGKKMLKVRHGLFWKKEPGDFEIEYSEIASVNIIRQNETIQKQKNAVGRALAGGLVFGPVGAVVGGFSGIGKKEKRVKHEVLYIELKDGTEYFFAIEPGNSNQSMIALHILKYIEKNMKNG